MRDKFHNVLDWVGLFAILGLLVAILGYGHIQVIVERTVQEVSEGYEQDITALLMGQLLSSEPDSVTIWDSELGNPVFSDKFEIEALTDMFRRIKWEWSGNVIETPSTTPQAGPIVEIELNFGHEVSTITLPSIVINGRIYNGFIEDENALNFLYSEVNLMRR